MPAEYDHKDKDRSLDDHSLDTLISMALAESLVENVRIEGDRIILSQRKEDFQLGRSQARIFLIGMLRGRSWYQTLEQEVPHAARDESLAERIEEGPVDRQNPQKSNKGYFRGVSSMLNALLSYTKAEGWILDYRRDDAAQTVEIDLTACSISLNFEEAVVYLTGCIQDHVLKYRASLD